MGPLDTISPKKRAPLHGLGGERRPEKLRLLPGHRQWVWGLGRAQGSTGVPAQAPLPSQAGGEGCLCPTVQGGLEHFGSLSLDFFHL